MDPVELLLDELVDGGAWPPARYAKRIAHIRTMRAFLESDREALRVIADWPKDRGYKVDALPGLIADAWADHLWGEDPVITPANERDTSALEFVLEGNGDLTGDLHAAERIVAGEGERWWRVYVDEEVADVPLLEWHDADLVFPLYLGRRLLAVALLTELPRRPRERAAVYRHFEIHYEGAVEHVLFRGTRGKIGATVPLDSHPDLADLALTLAGAGDRQVWAHGLQMLMGRITNGRKRIRALGELGVSDFYVITDDLLDLNEAKSIAGENVRLTAKRRVVVPEDSVAPAPPELVDRGDGTFDRVPRAGRFDAGEDVLVVSKLDAELGRGSDAPFKVLEYSFDAEPLLAHKRDLVESALTRTGLTPQSVGVSTGNGDGFAVSGTALRLRLIPETKAGRGKARPWDDELPVTLSRLAEVDALAVDAGGFGRSWVDAGGIPAVERSTSLPHDDVEDATVESTLVGAGVRSIETSVRAQHPDWTDKQVGDELDRIKADKAAAPGLGASLAASLAGGAGGALGA